MQKKIDRVNVSVGANTYEKFAGIAKMLGLTIKDATEQAISEWNDRNTAAAKKKANQLLAA